MIHFLDLEQGAGSGGGHSKYAKQPLSTDWGERPFMVIWEATRACALSCRHCRASANSRRHPLELTRTESLALIDQVARAAPDLFVITGGDPAMRPDLEELVEFASKKGLRVAVSPSATARWLNADLPSLRSAGLAAVSLSLDGATQQSHDRFRGVYGTWKRTMLAIEGVKDADISLQINTTITRKNLKELPEFVRLMEDIQPAVWSVFGLIQTGRARKEEMPTPVETEELLEFLADLSGNVPFGVKTTELPQFRRKLIEKNKVPMSDCGRQGIGDGKGFVFVSHVGEIFPSGFLPVSAGNVRRQELSEVYRKAPLFRFLRDSSRLRGKCGRCKFRKLCGGSRSRAFSVDGDYLGAEPLCPYEPQADEAVQAVGVPSQKVQSPTLVGAGK